MKTHSGSKDRFTITGTGKVMRSKLARRHLKYGKTKRVLSADEKKFVVSKTYAKKLRALLPYSAK